jgi:hypothetical protein
MFSAPYDHRPVHDDASTRLREWYNDHVKQEQEQEITKNAAEPEIMKVGPEGYIHGWIKVGPGEGVVQSRKEVPGGMHLTSRIKKPKGGEGGRDLSESQLKPGHVIQLSDGSHHVVTGKTGGYKFKNPAHPNGMREVSIKPVNDDGSVDDSAPEKSTYFDRDSKVHVAGHVPGTAGARANDSGNPVVHRYNTL